MDNCQHLPAKITREPQGSTGTVLIRCTRCGIETKPLAYDGTAAQGRQIWSDWAELMVRESAAREERLRVDQGSKMEPSFTERHAAACWAQFIFGAGLSFSKHLNPEHARLMGVNYREAALVHDTLKRHLKGPITTQRLSDLFVLFRKATRAFHMWGVLEEPKDEK